MSFNIGFIKIAIASCLCIRDNCMNDNAYLAEPNTWMNVASLLHKFAMARVHGTILEKE